MGTGVGRRRRCRCGGCPIGDRLPSSSGKWLAGHDAVEHAGRRGPRPPSRTPRGRSAPTASRIVGREVDEDQRVRIGHAAPRYASWTDGLTKRRAPCVRPCRRPAAGPAIVASARPLASAVQIDRHAAAVAHHDRVPPTTTSRTVRPSLAHTSCSTGSVPRGANCGPRRRARRCRPACRPRASRSDRPLPTRLGAADRRQRQAVGGRPGPRGSPARSRPRPTNRRGRREHVDARRRRSRRRSPSATRPPRAQQLAVPAGAGDSLRQSQVGPRARGDRVSGAQHDVDLGVVEVHGVGQQHVRAEHAELVEVHAEDGARFAQVAGGVPVVRRHVEREAGAALAGQLARADDQLVAHQVVADQRHPALHQAAGAAGRGRSRRRWRGRAPRRPEPAKGTSSTSQPHGPSVPASPTASTALGTTRSGWATVPGLDGARDAVGDAPRRAPRVADSSSSSPVWAACTGTAHPKIASSECDRVGDARAHEPITGQVLVGVDVARGDDAPGITEDVGQRMRGRAVRRTGRRRRSSSRRRRPRRRGRCAGSRPS